MESAVIERRRRAESVVIEKGGHTPNTPEGTISPQFGSLNERRRAEAAVIDPKWHESTPKNKTKNHHDSAAST